MNVAVITGASMGLGEEFARQLAARKENLVLVARSAARLEALAKELHDRHGIHAFPFACDLAQPNAAQQVEAFLREKGLVPTWLINNAGFGLVGALDSLEPQRVHEMMMLNVVTLVDLTRLLLPELRLQSDARVINVASTASLQPVPFFNVYAATKVFVLNFSDALAEELRGTNVRVLALCPGPTPTQFHVSAGMDEKIFQKGQSAADVVRMGLVASDRDRVILICQRAWIVLFLRLTPRWIVRRAAGWMAHRFIHQMKGH
jgi:hypothetical protein